MAYSTSLETAALSAHLDEPYSERSLSIFPKDFISLGGIERPTNGYITTGLIKPADTVEPIIWSTEESEIVVDAHTAMFTAMKQLAGEESFEASNIYFTHRRSYVPQGDAQLVSHNHLDGYRSRPSLKLIGVYHDVLPTIIIHNKTRLDDYNDEGTLKSVEGIEVNDAKLLEEELPCGQLLIVSPSAPHRGQIADRYID